MRVKCHNCHAEIDGAYLDCFKHNGDDAPVFHNFSLVARNDAREPFVEIQTTLNWCGSDLSDEERMECVRCPKCGKFPFAYGSINVRDELSLVMFPSEIDVANRDAAPGSAAALRQALNQLRTWALMDINENAASADETNYKKILDGIVEITNAALAAPARNCDVGTAEEQAQRFHEFCHSHRTFFAECSEKCPFRNAPDINCCQAGWGQLPYEKGGAE